MGELKKRRTGPRIARKRKPGFEDDPEDFRERSKPPPRQDPEGGAVAMMLCRLTGRSVTGYVVDWRPRWLPGDVDAFKYYFHEDGLIIDAFALPGVKDMDIMSSTPTWIEDQIAIKAPLCAKQGLTYIAVRPDEELDAVQLAARIGKTRITKKAKEDATL